MEIKNIIMAIGIFIMTMFVVVYGFNVFYPSVKYEDFCGRDIWNIDNQEDCINAGGVWNEDQTSLKLPEVPAGRFNCSPPQSCDSEYRDAREKRAKMIFYFSIPLGILIIVLGSFLFSLDAVGVGIMFGGLGTFVYGAGGYWTYGGEIMRFVLSLIGLIILIIVAYIANKKFVLPFSRKKRAGNR